MGSDYSATRFGPPRTTAEKAIRATALAKRTLAGFTTVRDLGASDCVDVALRNSIAAGVVAGPRMLVATNALGARGGHADGDGFPYMLFGRESGIANGIAAGPDQFRDAVRFAVKYGADVIKVMATGGVLSLQDEVDTPQVTQAEMDALVDEAHRLRKKTAAHAHGIEGAKTAIRAGIDSIEHGSFLDEETLRMVEVEGTFFVPTHGARVRRRPAREDGAPRERRGQAKAAGEAGEGVPTALKTGVKSHSVRIRPSARTERTPRSSRSWSSSAWRPRRAEVGAGGAAELLGLEKSIGALRPRLRGGRRWPCPAIRSTTSATERVLFVMKGGTIVRKP